MRARRLSEIRFYLYQSRTKLDMLYGQLASTKGPFTGSISLEVPGIKASLSTSKDADESQYERLDAVEKELRKRGLVGTIADPKEYFAGEMRMRWGMFDDHGRRGFDEAPFVFFGGVDPSLPMFVGLGGSSHHVTGYEGASSTHSRSTTRAIVDWITAGLEDREPLGALHPDFEGERQMVMSGVAIAIQNLRPPTQKLKFLAKTLLAGRIYGHEHITGFPEATGLLGTPLYVSQVDRLDDEQRWGLDDQWELPPVTAKSLPQGTARALPPVTAKESPEETE